MKQLFLAGIAALAVAGCATTGSGGKDGGERVVINPDPFPSTYQRYAGAPVVITNVTILDGEGGRIEGGQIHLADGKIVAVGQSVSAPAGIQVIDGQGKYVTPGIIDVHSHLGDYPSPAVEAHEDGNEATALALGENFDGFEFFD